MAFAQDIVESRDPIFTGKDGRTREPAADLNAARDLVRDLKSGALDPFLARAWETITIRQNRNPDGTFAKGYTIAVDFRRPGPGDDSTAAPGPENPIGQAPGPPGPEGGGISAPNPGEIGGQF